MGRNVKKKSEYLLGEAIQKMLEETHLEQPYVERRIASLCNELMGPLARYILKVELREETLYVTVTSPLVRQELNMLRNEILQKLSEHIGSKYLKKIVIR